MRGARALSANDPGAARPGATPAAAETDEARLAAGVRARDVATFETLVRDYGPPLLRMVRSVLVNEEEARDALQETFTSAYQRAESFRGESRVLTWLRRIAFNAALMRLRTRRRRNERAIEDLLPSFAEDGHFELPEPGWVDPLKQLEDQEARALVHAALEELPESYRTVITLRDLEELDTQETAHLLDVSPGAVKVRLHRARQALRALLAPRFQEVLP